MKFCNVLPNFPFYLNYADAPDKRSRLRMETPARQKNRDDHSLKFNFTGSILGPKKHIGKDPIPDIRFFILFFAGHIIRYWLKYALVND